MFVRMWAVNCWETSGLSSSSSDGSSIFRAPLPRCRLEKDQFRPQQSASLCTFVSSVLTVSSVPFSLARSLTHSWHPWQSRHRSRRPPTGSGGRGSRSATEVTVETCRQKQRGLWVTGAVPRLSSVLLIYGHRTRGPVAAAAFPACISGEPSMSQSRLSVTPPTPRQPPRGGRRVMSQSRRWR